MDVSVIIVNYNTKDLTNACIDSIFKQTSGIDFEVILVDNNSTDGSVEMFMSDLRIKFIESGANIGFGKANNLGVSVACGEYIFFLNSDTILENNAVKLFFDFYKKHESKFQLGAVGTLLLDGNGNRTHSFSNFPKMSEFIRHEFSDHISKFLRRSRKPRLIDTNIKIDTDYYEVDYVTGADLFTKRFLIDKLGGFDPDFFMYYEETEMQFRWKMNGCKNYIIKEPQIIHLERKSSSNTTNVAKIIRIAESLLLYFKKTSSIYRFSIFRFLYFVMKSHFLFTNKMTLEEKKKFLFILIRK